MDAFHYINFISITIISTAYNQQFMLKYNAFVLFWLFLFCQSHVLKKNYTLKQLLAYTTSLEII